MVTKNCFITTADLKDAYCSVSISRLFQKFLKFKWKNKLYCFICFPNGLGYFLRKFTISNTVKIKTLHFENILLSGYMEGFFNKGNTTQFSCTTSWILS